MIYWYDILQLYILEEIVEMQRLYRKLGTYAAVARYVQMKGVPTNIRIAVENLSRETK